VTKTIEPKPPVSAERYMVPVVKSTFRILEELSKAGALGLNEVTQRTGVSKSTVFRVLTTLTHLGYVVRDPERNYCVSHTLSSLVSESDRVGALRRTAIPWMLKLRSECGETVNLGRLQFDKVIYIEVVPSEYALRFSEQPGSAISAHATALGKAILAFSDQELVEGVIRGRQLQMYTHNTITNPDELLAELQRVRERGYAVDRGEAAALATCVAVPIFDAFGKPLAAISLSGPTSRFNPRANSPVIESLRLAAADISRQFQRKATRVENADL
jgi:DNA-binding IclR family transcriptional regulator